MTLFALLAAGVSLQNSLLKIGDPAPAFSLPDENGRPVTLEHFRGKTVVLMFFPKDFTPG